MNAETPGRAAGWWVCDGPLPAGRKITGPFATQELALTVRAYVEKAEGRTDLWVDDEAQQPQPAPGHMMVMRGTIALREAEIELLNDKLAEEKRIHRELLEAVLRHADNEADRDYPTPESRAQAYVELLEERNIELYSLIAEAQPAPELGADEVRETPGGAQ